MLINKTNMQLTWQHDLRAAIRDPAVLVGELELDPAWIEPARRVAKTFPLVVTNSFLKRMNKGNARDPLLLQVLPWHLEAAEVTGFTPDPLAEAKSRKGPGILHKYHGRALIVATSACAIHCRYCFRRHFPYTENPSDENQWRQALVQISNDPSINEVILSGGDPLTLTNARLFALVAQIEAIAHVKTLRIHTRMPVVLPARIETELLDRLRALRLQTIFVIHANHAQELRADADEAIAKIRAGGFMIFNQSVLLRGVNDSVSALSDLCRRLVEVGVTPYYIHQLDRVSGAAHFEVPVEEGRALMRQLHAVLPGYALPRYVQEIPGAVGKTWL